MATLFSTQYFMADHKDHSLSISMIETIDSRYITEIKEIDGSLFAMLGGEKASEEHVENTGAYLFCHDCKVEEELNLGEVIED